jgi:hypothetical protein
MDPALEHKLRELYMKYFTLLLEQGRSVAATMPDSPAENGAPGDRVPQCVFRAELEGHELFIKYIGSGIGALSLIDGNKSGAGSWRQP